MKHLKASLGIVITLALLARGQAQSSFTNGSFELPAIGPQSEILFHNGDTGLPGWTIGGSSSTLTLINGNLDSGLGPEDGSQYLAFNAGNTPTGLAIFQSLDTTVGRRYRVGFNVGRTGPSPGLMQITATVTGSDGSGLAALTASQATNGWGPTNTLTFTATTAICTLIFQDTSLATDGVDVALDNVSVAPVQPYGATASPVLASGFVVGASITDGGYGYTSTPPVRFIGGGGAGAGGFAVVTNGVVASVTVTNAGYGYTSAPLIVIEPPFIPNPVLSIAPMSFLTFYNLAVGGNYQLQQFASWYWVNQPVSFTATNGIFTEMVVGVAGSGAYRLALNPVPAQAFATSQVVNGFVVGATVTSGGSGYYTIPAVSVSGDVGSNATAVATISGGTVTGVTILDAGGGYTNGATVEIDPPPAAAVAPTVQPVMRLDCASLSPYDNYQIQFKPGIGAPWGNWVGGLFSPTAATNSQYLFTTNAAGFFRLQYVP